MKNENKIKHILWINIFANFTGGCEHYISQTAALLQGQGIRNTVLYDVKSRVDKEFTSSFDAAFPIVDIKKQLLELNPDIVYIHQLTNNNVLQAIIDSPYPAAKFFHDHELFCLRKHKIKAISGNPCTKTTGFGCYPCLGFVGKEDGKLKFKRLASLQNDQKQHQNLDAFITGSSYMTLHIQDHGFDANKCYTIPLYATPACSFGTELHESRKTATFLFVGRLDRGKGWDVVLNAMVKLDDATLFIAGSGKDEAKARQFVESNGLNDRVKFLGHITQAELIPYYQQATALVVPYRGPETFGQIGPEAMRLGIPVISTNIGGMSEWLIQNQTGIAVPPGDVKKLADAMKALIDKPEDGSRMGLNAVDYYNRKFRPETHIKKLLEILNNVVVSHQDCWGRFTLDGGEMVERSLAGAVRQVAMLVQTIIPSKDYVSLLVLGGYGRGEGGVEVKNGIERPHNNIDFMLITRNLRKLQNNSTEKRLSSTVIALADKLGIDVDFSMVSAQKLKREQPLVIWHDMYHGHKVIIGDTGFFKSLTRHQFAFDICSRNIRNLLVNRGMLLLINELILKKDTVSETDKRTVIKHVMKAIIGYGDALLYFLGQYSWSYAAKQWRMRKADGVPEAFKALYEEAMTFRFHPNYDKYMNDDLSFWMTSIRSILADIHLLCEQKRLRCSDFTWDNYLDKALTFALFDITTAKDIIKKLFYLIKPKRNGIKSSLSCRSALGYATSSQRDIIPLIFPYVAYRMIDTKFGMVVSKILQTSDQMTAAFIKFWATYENPNFNTFQKEGGLCE